MIQRAMREREEGGNEWDECKHLTENRRHK